MGAFYIYLVLVRSATQRMTSIGVSSSIKSCFWVLRIHSDYQFYLIAVLLTSYLPYSAMYIPVYLLLCITNFIGYASTSSLAPWWWPLRWSGKDALNPLATYALACVHVKIRTAALFGECSIKLETVSHILLFAGGVFL